LDSIGLDPALRAPWSNSGVNKSDLPTRTCAVCRRPFAWRRKWRDCWEEVRYCSERCRRNRRMARPATRAAAEKARG